MALLTLTADLMDLSRAHTRRMSRLGQVSDYEALNPEPGDSRGNLRELETATVKLALLERFRAKL